SEPLLVPALTIAPGVLTPDEDGIPPLPPVEPNPPPDEWASGAVRAQPRNSSGFTGSLSRLSSSVTRGLLRGATPSAVPPIASSRTGTSLRARPVTALDQPPECSMSTNRP